MSQTMQQFEISRDDDSDLRFTGKLLAHTSTRTLRGDNQNRWEEFYVYVTKAGSYVCAQEFHSQWQGEDGENHATICNSKEEVVEFFGYCKAAKELYRELNIPFYMEVK